MTTYEFTIVLADIDDFSDDALDQLFEAGCDDGTPGRFAGECLIAFDRTAPSLEDAIRSAIKNVRSVGFSIKRVVMEEAAVIKPEVIEI